MFMLMLTAAAQVGRCELVDPPVGQNRGCCTVEPKERVHQPAGHTGGLVTAAFVVYIYIGALGNCVTSNLFTDSFSRNHCWSGFSPG